MAEWRLVSANALLTTLLLATQAPAQPPPDPGPVIDMHVHAGRLQLDAPVPICPGDQAPEYPAIDPKDLGRAMPPQCTRPVFSPTTSAALKNGTIAELRRYNVRRAVLAGAPALVKEWTSAAPDLFIAAAVPAGYSAAALAYLRQLHRERRAAIFAELGAQYAGVRADSPELAAFWSLAEELDVPVGIHLGEGMPGQSPTTPGDGYRVSLTSPYQLEEVLIKHPRLRLYVMHAASPLIDEMIAMLFEYPTLYVDVGANVWNMPRAQFYQQLQRMVDAGYAKRIMFGSDQTIWPQGIGLAVESIQNAPFLTAEQKRDILYNNAARFLRLTTEQIAGDHAPRP